MAGTAVSLTAHGRVVAWAGLAMLTSSPDSGKQITAISKQIQNQLLLYFSSGKMSIIEVLRINFFSLSMHGKAGPAPPLSAVRSD